MEVNQQEIEQKIEEMKQHIRKAEVSTCSLIKTKITIPTGVLPLNMGNSRKERMGK